MPKGIGCCGSDEGWTVHFSYQDIKGTLYAVQTLVGLLLLTAALYLFHLMPTSFEPISYAIPGVILLVVGGGCTFFGIETYLLRDDPDIWR